MVWPLDLRVFAASKMKYVSIKQLSFLSLLLPTRAFCLTPELEQPPDPTCTMILCCLRRPRQSQVSTLPLLRRRVVVAMYADIRISDHYSSLTTYWTSGNRRHYYNRRESRTRMFLPALMLTSLSYVSQWNNLRTFYKKKSKLSWRSPSHVKSLKKGIFLLKNHFSKYLPHQEVY